MNTLSKSWEIPHPQGLTMTSNTIKIPHIAPHRPGVGGVGVSIDKCITCLMTTLKMRSWCSLTSQEIIWKIYIWLMHCHVLQLQQTRWNHCLWVKVAVPIHLPVCHWQHQTVTVAPCWPCLLHLAMPTKLKQVPLPPKARLPYLKPTSLAIRQSPHLILWKALAMSFLAVLWDLCPIMTRSQPRNWMLILHW